MTRCDFVLICKHEVCLIRDKNKPTEYLRIGLRFLVIFYLKLAAMK